MDSIDNPHQLLIHEPFHLISDPSNQNLNPKCCHQKFNQFQTGFEHTDDDFILALLL